MTGRDRIIAIVAGVGVILAAFWFGVVSPRRAESRQVAAQLTQARQERDSAVQAFQTANAAQHAARSAAAQLARLGQAVPPDDQTASLVYQLQAAAGRSHVSFDSLSLSGAGGAPAGNATAAPATTSTTPGAAAAAPTAAAPMPPGAVPGPAGLSVLPFSLSFEGTYFGLEHFLKRVHAFTTFRGDVIRVQGRLLQISSVNLTAAPSGFPHIQADLSVSAYMAAPVAATPAVAPAAPATGATPAAPTASTTPPTAPAAITGATG